MRRQRGKRVPPHRVLAVPEWIFGSVHNSYQHVRALSRKRRRACRWSAFQDQTSLEKACLREMHQEVEKHKRDRNMCHGTSVVFRHRASIIRLGNQSLCGEALFLSLEFVLKQCFQSTWLFSQRFSAVVAGVGRTLASTGIDASFL